jgi:hypothetical protein
MAVIRPPSISNANVTCGRPACPHPPPGRAADQRRSRAPRPAGERPRHRVRAAYLRLGAHRHRCGVRAQHHVRVEQREQRREVAAARRGEERVHDLSPRRR